MVTCTNYITKVRYVVNLRIRRYCQVQQRVHKNMFWATPDAGWPADHPGLTTIVVVVHRDRSDSLHEEE